MNKPRLTYQGKEVFVGIDVHKRSYVVTAVVSGAVIKRARMRANAVELLCYLKKNFEGSVLKTVYEAGFSGFVLHRLLSKEGIQNIVVNASSVEVSARDRVKTDKRDSVKLATQRCAGMLKGIRIPSEEQELCRQLSRTREQILSHRKRVMNQIRMRLHYFGLIDPNQHGALQIAFVNRLLKQDVPEELHTSITVLLDLWRTINEELKKLNKELRLQAKNDPYEKVYRSVPGIGPITARVLSNELGDMNQFPNERALFSFTGLTPSEDSSGERRKLGHISRQGSARLRALLVEDAWVAITKDKRLAEDFARISVRAGKKRAIVAIARKLIGRARALFRTGTLYEMNEKQAA